MHTQSREALNHLAYTIAAGGSGPRLRDGAVKQPSKLPGRPNSRGRLSLNFDNRTMNEVPKTDEGSPRPKNQKSKKKSKIQKKSPKSKSKKRKEKEAECSPSVP